MVALLYLIWDIGVRATLEHCYFLAVAGFYVCAGKVTGIVVFLACPYIPYLACFQSVAQNSVPYCTEVLESLVLWIHFKHLISPVIVLGQKISDTFCLYCWNVFYHCVILPCYHCEMAALR